LTAATILVESKVTTLRYRDLTTLIKLRYPRRIRMAREEKTNLLNEYIVREGLVREIQQQQLRIETTPEFVKLYKLHETDVLAFKMEQEELSRRIIVSYDMLSSYYEKNKGGSQPDKEYLCHEIRIAIEKSSDMTIPQQYLVRETAIQKAKTIRDRIMHGANFEEIAKSNSLSPTATDGGKLPWMKAFAGGVQFQRALQNLQPGQLSEPIVGSSDLLLLQLDEIRQPEPPPLDSMLPKIKLDYYRQQEIREAKKLEDALLQEAKFTVLK